MADEQERREEDSLIEEATTAYQKALKPLSADAPEFKPGGRKSRKGRKGGRKSRKSKKTRKSRKGGKWSY